MSENPSLNPTPNRNLRRLAHSHCAVQMSWHQYEYDIERYFVFAAVRRNK